ncbi:MAG TPA: carboxylating nicotinate-nucleotide diphosphorylase, partial [Chthoniobacteraceae bacterium]|nr:carboxylating nicotinate-nucleotide diphosphorylase [Chthoniobacteraceae bacterium]
SGSPGLSGRSIRQRRAPAHDIVAVALEEDAVKSDYTSQNFILDREVHARIVAKENAVVAGTRVAEDVFGRIDGSLRVKIIRSDGERVKRGATVMDLQGSARSILTGERVALNFLQRLSGIATLTRRYVEAAGTRHTKILDTRKTTPGLRALEKGAVIAGGGMNHRFGLDDMVMIKDNHLLATGDPARLQGAIRKFRTLHKGVRIEVEADTLRQVQSFLRMDGIDIILLDNMSVREMRAAVKLGRGRVRFEASGGVTLRRVRKIAATGVDFISVGALTHSAPAIDYTLEILL